MLLDSPSFLFMTCQVGAEPALKQEVARAWPPLRFAFSRPGFLTFKVPADLKVPEDLTSELVFARAAGVCLGKVTADAPSERADRVWKLIGDRNVTQLHVWPRDRYRPGFRDYDPGMTADAAECERIIRERAPEGVARRLSPRAVGCLHELAESLNFRYAPPAPLVRGELQHRDPAGSSTVQTIAPPCPPRRWRRGPDAVLVADVVIVDAAEWWVGYHQVESLVSSWPGGFCQAAPPPDAVSRAYLKTEEALLWSGFQVRPGDRCVEIGSAPGGASQFLLAQRLEVVGVDPAEMDPAILENPHFRHIRRRSKEVPRNEFLGVDWLTCDVNLPPNYTLDAVRAIVSHTGVRFKGMLLTLKLVEWSLAEEIPKYLDRVRSWGFRNVRARQLHHNHQEVCVAASSFRPPNGKADRSRKPNRDGAVGRPSSPDKNRRSKSSRKHLASD